MGEITLDELRSKENVIYKNSPSNPIALIEIAKVKINEGEFEKTLSAISQKIPSGT